MHVERISSQNRATVNNFILEQWYTTKMIIRGKEIDMTSVEGVVVFENDEIIGENDIPLKHEIEFEMIL